MKFAIILILFLFLFSCEKPFEIPCKYCTKIRYETVEPKIGYYEKNIAPCILSENTYCDYQWQKLTDSTIIVIVNFTPKGDIEFTRTIKIIYECK